MNWKFIRVITRDWSEETLPELFRGTIDAAIMFASRFPVGNGELILTVSVRGAFQGPPPAHWEVWDVVPSGSGWALTGEASAPGKVRPTARAVVLAEAPRTVRRPRCLRVRNDNGRVAQIVLLPGGGK